jgi:hypothetical protein
MARGWESKSVEDQMAAAEERRLQTPRSPASPEERDRQSRRDGLRLSRTRILGDLEQAGNARYRAQLQQALDFIDQQLRELIGDK